MNATYYVVKADRELGPYTPTQIKQLAASGQLASEDLVRPADVATAVKASTIAGLFTGMQTADAPQAVPPPLPSERGSFTDRLRKTAADVAETTKAAGLLAAVEARKAKLKNIDLPAAYLALGRDIHAAGRFRDEFAELYAEIEAIQAEITRLTTGHETKSSATFAEKARQTASGMKDTAQAKMLGHKANTLLKQLGEVAFDRFNESCGGESLVGAIKLCRKSIQDADTEIRLNSLTSRGKPDGVSEVGGVVQPRQYPWWLLLVSLTVFPVTLYLVWRKSDCTKRARWAWTAACALPMLIMVAQAQQDVEKANRPTEATTSEKPRKGLFGHRPNRSGSKAASSVVPNAEPSVSAWARWLLCRRAHLSALTWTT